MRALVILFIFSITFTVNSKAQELEATWGGIEKVKKTGDYTHFDLAGVNQDKVLIVNHGSKGIVFNFFNKEKLDLLKSVPLKLEPINWQENKEVKPSYFKAIVLAEKIYLLVYLDIVEKNKGYNYNKKFPLLFAPFSFEGKMLAEWKNIDKIEDADRKITSVEYFSMLTDKVILNKKNSLILIRTRSSGSNVYSFYDYELNKLDIDTGVNYNSVMYANSGRVLLIEDYLNKAGGRKKCLNIKEIEHTNHTLRVKQNKCIPTTFFDSLLIEDEYNTNLGKNDSDTISRIMTHGLVGDKYFQIFKLIREGKTYKKAQIWRFDIEKYTEEPVIEYIFTEKEQKEFANNAIALTRESDKKDKDKKPYYISTPSYSIGNLPFFHGELKSKSDIYEMMREGGEYARYRSMYVGKGNNFGSIFTFWLADSNKISYSYVPKRQYAHVNERWEEYLSYLPYYFNGFKYYLFVGNGYNFYGINMRLLSPESKDASLGYISIDKDGHVTRKEFTKLSKELYRPPHIRNYFFDDENNLYLFALKGLKKVRLIKVSPKD